MARSIGRLGHALGYGFRSIVRNAVVDDDRFVEAASRNSRGGGLPAEGSADTDPISKTPNPSAARNSTARAFLSQCAGRQSDRVGEADTGNIGFEPRIGRGVDAT